MITFITCLALLIISYFTHARYLAKVIKIDRSAPVPSRKQFDGVDYVPLRRGKAFLIQLLNIAGIGPIFGAISGACFGPIAFVWITLGGIFIGGMHDYFFGVISVRNKGISLPEILGKYFGKTVRTIMRAVIFLILILISVVFLRSPAEMLKEFIPSVGYYWWVAIIFLYYIVSSIFSLNDIIGKIYPVFGGAMLIMAVGLGMVLLNGEYSIPELTTLRNFHTEESWFPVFPTLFITIACGALSGFHATQSPMIARCVRNEKDCRPVFFGAMIAESCIALIWAAIAMAFFGGAEGLGEQMKLHSEPYIVEVISTSTMGGVGAILALFAVIIAPVTSGDTALRSARLVVADIFQLEQKTFKSRFKISIPIAILCCGLLFVDFDVVWRYFSWSNQTLATVVLWCITIYLKQINSKFWISYIPAILFTAICSTFIFVSNQFVGLGASVWSYIAGGVMTVLITFMVSKVYLFNPKSAPKID